jgi:aldehyde:ferredoxin oxidoreductase
MKNVNEIKILRINLSTKKITAEIMDEKLTDLFLGGRGINRWILLNEIEKGIKAFDLKNKIVIGTGLLVGSSAPGACRVQIDTLGPFNNGVASANSGGFFGAQLRFAGWDNIVIEGKAMDPVYIYIKDKDVRIMDAKNIWGKTTWKTQDAIQAIHGKDTSVLTIGPAGENLVYSAAIIVDKYRSASRCGIGAVMGSKNLKAISVEGTGSVIPVNQKGFEKKSAQLKLKILKSENGKKLKKYGTPYFLNFINDISFNVVRNFQDCYVDPEKFKNIFPNNWSNITSEEIETCFGCPISCSFLSTITDGPYKGTRTASCQGNAFWDFCTKLDIYDAAVAHKAQELCNRYGLDIDSVSGAISWAYECYEKGIIDQKDTDGLELVWGQDKPLMILLKKIAKKDGFGKILAYGCHKASKIVGKGSSKYCLHIKGQDLKESVRTVKGWALGVMVSPRAGTHTRGCPQTEILGMSKEDGEKYYGVSTAGDQLSYEGKAKLVIYFEREMALLDSLGMCALVSEWGLGPGVPGIKDFTELCSAFLGKDITYEDMLKKGERIATLEKYFNQIHTNFVRKDDFPPNRLMKEEVKTGPLKGEKLDKEKWSKMLDEYYELHKWNKESGEIPKERLKELDILI